MSYFEEVEEGYWSINGFKMSFKVGAIVRLPSGKFGLVKKVGTGYKQKCVDLTMAHGRFLRLNMDSANLFIIDPDVKLT